MSFCKLCCKVITFEPHKHSTIHDMSLFFHGHQMFKRHRTSNKQTNYPEATSENGESCIESIMTLTSLKRQRSHLSMTMLDIQKKTLTLFV